MLEEAKSQEKGSWVYKKGKKDGEEEKRFKKTKRFKQKKRHHRRFDRSFHRISYMPPHEEPHRRPHRLYKALQTTAARVVDKILQIMTWLATTRSPYILYFHSRL